MSSRLLPVLLLAASVAARAAEPPVFPAAPLVASAPVAAGAGLLKLNAARSALALGFPSQAAALDEELLAAPETPAADRNALVLDLVSARLNEGRLADAERALQRYTGLPTAAHRLRAGLIAVRAKRLDAARAAAGSIRPEELPAGDRGWFYFLQGALADAAGVLAERARAGDFYKQAADAAGSDLQRAQFTLARELAQLNTGEVTEAQAAALRQSADRYQGRSQGYDNARLYAVAEASLTGPGHGPAVAAAYLQQQLQVLPPAARATNDDFRLLLGVIAGAKDGVGRHALASLLADADNHDFQRVALQLLANAAGDGPAREEFRSLLDGLIKSPVQHPIMEDLLLFRAQLALGEKNYAGAEADAKELLERFPGSQLKPDALAVRTGVAWEQHHYHTVADYAGQARAVLPPGDLRSRLGVLVAEADFRAEEYQNAAGAYAAALDEPPPDVAAGNLMFQLVLSEIRAHRLPEAARRIDELAHDPRFDVVNRWQAEWNLARGLQAAGNTKEALARVDELLKDAAATAALPARLRVQMAWLQTRLALEAGGAEPEPAKAKELLEHTLTLAQALLDSLTGAVGLEKNLSDEVAAGTRLLQARANFRLDRPEQAVALLQQLRKDFPQADAAVFSYIAEADYDATKKNFVAAQNLLIKLADDFKGHPYAPYALYLAAGDAESRGQQDKYYTEAYNILGRLVKDYPQSDLVFYAWLKQGDLLRKLNDFAGAAQTYKYLTDNFPQHADVLTAELDRADCLRAQMADNLSYYESALNILERLQALAPPPPPARVDLHVEARYKLGDLLAQRGTPETLARAQTEWLKLVNDFLLDEAQAARLGSTGRYWMARTLLHYGDSLAQQGRLEEAGNAYRLLLAKGLPNDTLARRQLAGVGGKP